MSDGNRSADGKDISALFGVLRRSGWIVVLCVAVAAAATYAYSDREKPTYEASANLLLRDPAPGPNAALTGTPTPDTAPDREALVLSEPVKARVVKALAPRVGGTRAAEAALAGALALSAPESDAVDITSTAPDGTTAALVANTIAEQNIAYRKARSVAQIRRAQRVARRALSRTNPEQIATVNQIQNTLQTLNQAAGVQNGDAEILERATVPTSPAAPKPRRSALIGGFAGLLLGLALALVREQLDRRLRGTKDLGDTFDLPILATLPTSRAFGKKGRGVELQVLPPGEREAFQMLRANLRFLSTDTELRSVVVTSAAPGDGKTTVAINLAVADASVGRNVLLIEADMRRPSIGKVRGLAQDRGLSSYLARPDAQLEDVIQRVPVTPGTNGNAPLMMDVVVCGAIPSNPSELINSERMRTLISGAEEKYDLVVIDTSPVGVVADAIPLMSEASAVIIVSRVGRITTVEADALRDQLKRIDAPAFGLVANFAGARGKEYSYY